jgi:hypothetical protein
MKMRISASVVNGIVKFLPKPNNPLKKQAILNNFSAGGVAMRNIATIFNN